jgi:hypothetical protein
MSPREGKIFEKFGRSPKETSPPAVFGPEGARIRGSSQKKRNAPTIFWEKKQTFHNMRRNVRGSRMPGKNPAGTGEGGRVRPRG